MIFFSQLPSPQIRETFDRLALSRANYREAKRPDGTLGFAAGRGRGATFGAGWFGDVGSGPAPAKDSVKSTVALGGQFRSDDDEEEEEEEILMVSPVKASPHLPASSSFSSKGKAEGAKPRLKLRLDEVRNWLAATTTEVLWQDFSSHGPKPVWMCCVWMF